MEAIDLAVDFINAQDRFAYTSIYWWLILIHSNEDSSLWSVWIKNQGDRVRNLQMIQKQQGGRWNLLFQLFPDRFWFLFARSTHYMRSLLFEQSQEDVCAEVDKSLQHQEQDPSPARNLGQRYPQAFLKKMGRCGELLLLDPMLLKSKNHTKCLRMLCLLILFPDTGQTEVWWPKISMTCNWHAEQRWSWLKMGIPSHLFMQIDHSKQENVFWCAGRAWTHAVAWGMEHASNLALLRLVESARRVRKLSKWMWWDRLCWLEGHDELSELSRQWSKPTKELNIEIALLMCELDTCLDRKDSISGLDIKKEAIKAVAELRMYFSKLGY